jgi:hypothetical protein
MTGGELTALLMLALIAVSAVIVTAFIVIGDRQQRRQARKP